ncbi:MAG: acyl-CoA dehydratase activase [Bacteroidales bacterium]|jgi:predicted CoA-substrate-specific enzyme activase|nr:acyl-CoA dehydratase activase [Bacteroidales bacterium]
MGNKFVSGTTDGQYYLLGVDIGSVSLNTVVMDANHNIIEEYYDYVHGKPFNVLNTRLVSILERIGSFEGIAFTGTGGKLATELIGGVFVNEIIAQATSSGKLFPDAKTVIEIGGEDSKLIILEKDPVSGTSRLVDFEMNSICAAGTGSFLDQQARRIGVPIEKEFGEMSLKSTDPPRIAGRCSVFAKSDMIHHQQIATPLHDIVAGLCFALARNFRSNVARSKEINKPVIFSGGVAANTGMIRAFTKILDLKEGELIIPEHHASMGAIGAVMYATSNNLDLNHFRGLEKLQEYLADDSTTFVSLPKLTESEALYNKDVYFKKNGNQKLKVYLGVDVGSLSTNVVLIDTDHNVIARRYLPTAGKPLEAIQKGITEIYDEVGEDVEVIGAGTTGSGRYLTGDFIGADTIQNEITAQATAAIDYDPTVDTIFEIGGQDSKYISIENGVVVDFEMNKVCAAGTGSFLEEQAEKLNINIVEEFGCMAMNSECPVKLGDRCTVFMESDLNSFMQKGARNENLVGGLAYSIVYNYLQKVVADRRIGDKIFFQGGVTNNKAVVAAFEQVLGKKIIIPPHFDVTGAIGAAILAKRSMIPGQKTTFRGFGIRNATYDLSRFVCQGCTNHCEIRRVKIAGEKKSLYYGGRCEKYETDGRKKAANDIPNLFLKRLEMLTEGYKEPKEYKTTTIGIPRALMVYYQQFPFWRTFFERLGFTVVISKESDKSLLTRSIETITTETCLPVEIMHGHVIDLVEKNVDYIFLPFIVNAKFREGNKTFNCNCPWIQTYPFMVKAALKGKIDESKLLIPTLHFRFFERALVKEMTTYFNEKFGIGKNEIREAIYYADTIQTSFEKRLVAYGKDVLKEIPKNCRPVVLLGKPYNSTDPHLNLGLIEKLISQNVMPIPIDMLDLSPYNIFVNYRNMYWPNGQKMIAAAQHVAKTDGLYAVYISNFRCGPDSFIWHYVTEELKGKPFLHLEVDEHSADAGMVTRIEAFLDSLKGSEQNEKKEVTIYRPRPSPSSPPKDRVLYFPYMNDGGSMLAAAARSIGVPSEVLPKQTEEDLSIGRKYTSSKECFPMICVTGSFIKKLSEPGADPSKMCFFMPDHNGPCRFGQYNHFHRILFDRLGYSNAELITPSNDTSYEDVAGEHGQKFRINAWKGFIVADYIRKIHREIRPYEINKGESDRLYEDAIKRLERCIERGSRGLHTVLAGIASDFMSIKVDKSKKKPVVAIIGEIFMRDNAGCNGNIANRLEELGVEVLIGPFSEWIYYSTYRFTRDSRWKNDNKGIIKSKIQGFGQDVIASSLLRGIKKYTDHQKDVSLHDMLNLCNTYVNEFYDGDPPIAMGTSVALTKRGVSGFAAILPFTCMPGTLIASVSDSFRKDHNNIPFLNIAYDGQDTVSLDTRLQAFVFQVKEFAAASELSLKHF